MLAILTVLILTVTGSIIQESFARPSASAEDWKTLGDSVGGRLYPSLPLASPCFSRVNGQNSETNLTACSAVQDGYTLPSFRSPQYGAFMMPHWETCQRTTARCLLDASQPNNPDAWTDSECSQGSVSPYYIQIQNAEDVQKAFKFSARTGVPLSIKASGHDYKGRSSLRGSLALWTRKLNTKVYSTNFAPEGGNTTYRAITMGAGVSFEELYEFSDENNVTVIGGYHETVSPSGGWLMGGGHSILTPVYGLGVDRVLQFKLVTPDGQYRVANAFQNSDLFWALRGGGGSTFGVVLESTTMVEPQMSIQVASIRFAQTAGNAAPFLKLIVDHTYKWGLEGWGGHMNPAGIINVTPLLTLDEAKESVQPIVEYALAQNGTAVIEELPSWQEFFKKYVLSAQASVGHQNILGGRLIPSEKFANDAGKAEVVSIMTNMVEQFGINPYIVVGTPFLYNHIEGATSVTPAWRNALWQIGFHSGWEFNATREEMKTEYDIVSTITQWMRDISPDFGAYFNEGDIYEPNHEAAFWGPNYEALLEIKKKYDPLGLLDCWQCVGWKGADDERYACYL